jgi:isoleucyl-tRNA synthetase
MSRLRDKLLQGNQAISWVPSHIKEGRFGEWLKEIKDWAFSRERYWGTPLPVWVHAKGEECDHLVVVGSYEELEKLSGVKLEDPHRPYVDDVVIKCPKCSKDMRRTPEVVDVWFDSGAMPFAQAHWMGGELPEQFPADYISEAIDQTRGWFYTLLAVSTALGFDAPYKNVICLGHVLNAKGEKMSKSKGNVVDPWAMIEKYGADAIRFYMYTINQPGDPKRFDEKDLQGVVRETFLILWNVLTFYKMYASSSELTPNSQHILDRWILTKLNLLVKQVTENLENYHITEPGRAITAFINEFSTWYLRRSRDRFKNNDADALHTTHYVLLTLSKLLAPFTPFLAETLYREVNAQHTTPNSQLSVHLADWPVAPDNIDEQLLKNMEAVRKVCEMGHALRGEAKIKVRQPLGALTFKIQNGEKVLKIPDEFLSLIADELNVKQAASVDALLQGHGWAVSGEGDLTVALQVELSDELIEEGVAREFIRQVNDLRKEAGLTIKDRIALQVETNDAAAQKAIEKFQDHITKEVLANTISWSTVEGKWRKEIIINNVKTVIGF